jgi:hypothetical protein
MESVGGAKEDCQDTIEKVMDYGSFSRFLLLNKLICFRLRRVEWRVHERFATTRLILGIFTRYHSFAMDHSCQSRQKTPSHSHITTPTHPRVSFPSARAPHPMEGRTSLSAAVQRDAAVLCRKNKT